MATSTVPQADPPSPPPTPQSEIIDAEIVEEPPLRVAVVATEADAERDPVLPSLEVATAAAVESSLTAGAAEGNVPTMTPAQVLAAPSAPPAPIPPPVAAGGAVLSPTPLDFHKVAPRLYQGAAITECDLPFTEFTMIVLCSEEYQPKLTKFAGTVLSAPFNDTSTPTPKDLATAKMASDEVFKELNNGGRVLVTCTAGRNRSGLVVGLTLGRVMSGDDAVALIRHARGEFALSNTTFAELVRRCATGKTAVTTGKQLVAAPNKGILATIWGKVFVKPAAPNATPKRGAPKAIKKVGAGRGFFGKARTDRTPRGAK